MVATAFSVTLEPAARVVQSLAHAPDRLLHYPRISEKLAKNYASFLNRIAILKFLPLNVNTAMLLTLA